MIFGRVISCHHFFPLGYIDLICGIWVHSDQLQIKFTFRSGPMIFGILQTWHTYLWHQHISDMTLTFVYFTWHLCLWQQCFSDMTATFMTPVFFRNNSNIYDISVLQTCEQHLWHQCYSDMTFTFMTSVVFLDMTYTLMTSVYFSHDIYIQTWVFFRHSINIYNIIVFQTWHLHLWHQCIFTSHLHSWYQCFSDMTSTLMTSAFLRLDFQTWQHWWQCF